MSKHAKGTALTVVARAKQALSTQPTEAALIQLAKRSESIAEITNADGREQVHAARMLLKTTRCAIEKAGKDAREEAQKFSKAVIAEEKRLVALIEPEEGRLEQLQEEWDAAREREKQAAIEAEVARVEGIRERINEITGWPQKCGYTAEHAQKMLTVAMCFQVMEEEFQEFADEAVLALVASVAALRKVVEERVAHDVEQEQIRKDREELERLRAEIEALKAEQDRQAAERHRGSASEATPWKRDNEVTRDLLSLTGQGQCVPLTAIGQWTDEQCQQAEEWAGASHVHASDNDAVIVPPIPPHVAQWDTPEARERIAREDDEFWGRKSQPTPPSKPSDRDIIAVLGAHYGVPAAVVVEWILAMDLSQEIAA